MLDWALNPELTLPPRLRVSAVSYLNTVPLVWGMLHGPQRGRFDLEFSIPSECADRLAAGEADIGILPSIEFARQGLHQIPGTGIACRGAVRSILLISKVQPEEIRSLAVDMSSRTSVCLARIVLERKYGTKPQFRSMPPDLPAMLGAADAALIIGDAALRIEPRELPHDVLDLGEEWTRMTGLPMVFAVWGCRDRSIVAACTPEFAASCRFGLAHIDQIAAAEAGVRGFSEELAREYLTRNVQLELGPQEQQGLSLFLEYARQSGTLVSTGVSGK